MTRPKPKFTPEPRLWGGFQVATRLGCCYNTFKKMLPRLESEGFPQKDPLLDGWDSAAIEDWLDRRSGRRDTSSFPYDPDEELAAWDPSR